MLENFSKTHKQGLLVMIQFKLVSHTYEGFFKESKNTLLSPIIKLILHLLNILWTYLSNNH